MPQTTVNTPQGPVTVNHPEGASDESILRFAKMQVERGSIDQPEPPAPQAPAVSGVSDSSVENFLAGTGKGFSDLARGVRQRYLDLVSLLPETGLIRQTSPESPAGVPGSRLAHSRLQTAS